MLSVSGRIMAEPRDGGVASLLRFRDEWPARTLQAGNRDSFGDNLSRVSVARLVNELRFLRLSIG